MRKTIKTLAITIIANKQHMHSAAIKFSGLIDGIGELDKAAHPDMRTHTF